MIARVYSMFDAGAKAFGAPLVFQNDAVARRTAQALLMDNNSDQAKFPQDFSLWFIGEFSTETAEFKAVQPSVVFQLAALSEAGAVGEEHAPRVRAVQ